ncbi:hypothetical protein J6590_068330 [Homalodisca vitripennis]|nr:hypothetical protein J6590_068330 [Homalodisca vitripennis]
MELGNHCCVTPLRPNSPWSRIIIVGVTPLRPDRTWSHTITLSHSHSLSLSPTGLGHSVQDHLWSNSLFYRRPLA